MSNVIAIVYGTRNIINKLNVKLRVREREFIGTNIKQFHAKIKLRRWDTEKNLQNRLSRRAPRRKFQRKFNGIAVISLRVILEVDQLFFFSFAYFLAKKGI